MKKFKFIGISMVVVILLLFMLCPAAIGADSDPGPNYRSEPPWYPYNEGFYFGKTEYTGTLYIIFEEYTDRGRPNLPDAAYSCVEANSCQSDDYREYLVRMRFILELTPPNKKDPALYFSGTGKTCEDSILEPVDPYFPSCQEGEEDYYDLFYLPGDYLFRAALALDSFLNTEVYPVLCGDDLNCRAYLTEATYSLGTGNALDVVNPNADPDGNYSDAPPPPPWYWVQPIKIVTP
jgi:hypothetical protein